MSDKQTPHDNWDGQSRRKQSRDFYDHGHIAIEPYPSKDADTSPPPVDHVIRFPGYEGADRRTGYNDWRRVVHERLEAGAKDMSQLRADVDANAKDTKEIKENTGEILEILHLAKSAFKILDYIGSAVKWVVGVGAPVAALYFSIKGNK